MNTTRRCIGRVILGAACAGSLALTSVQQVTPIVVIGGRDSRGAELGYVRDVALLEKLIVVLDSSPPHIQVFDHRGNLKQTLGRKGAGPGEFEAPSAVGYDSAKRVLFVADRLASRLSRYAVGDSLTYVGNVRTSVIEMRGVCAFAGRVFALGFHGDGLIHELSLDPANIEPLRSFGSLKTSHALGANPRVKLSIPQGRMTCSAATQMAYTANALGDIHTVNLVSGAHTFAPLADFQPMKMTLSDRGGLTIQPPDGGYWHVVLDIQARDGGVTVIAGTRKQTGQPPPNSSELTGFFSQTVAPTGTQPQRSTTVWQPLGRIGETAVCRVQDPYPTIALFRLARCP